MTSSIIIRTLLLSIAMVSVAACSKSTSPPQSQPATAGTPRSSKSFQPTDPELITANNRGVGLMGKYEYESARRVFQQLVDQHPDWLDVKVNLAIATLNRQHEGDENLALALLQDVLARDADIRAHYCTGLLRLYLESPQDALPHFQFVAENDPHDAYAAYYLGQCLAQSQKYQDAIGWYEKAIANDAYLRSAYYAAGQAFRALGRDDDAKRMLDTFQSLESNPRATLAKFQYTRMGPKAEALAVNIFNPKPAPQPQEPVFADPVPLIENGERCKWKINRTDRPVSITACDIDNDGDIDIFIANVLDEDNGARNAVCINDGSGKFTLDTEHVLAMIPDVNAALWGDYDNDGLTDVYLCRRGPNMLWRQTAKNVWQDVTASTGTANGEYDTVDGAIFDADHDGDLDIFCCNFDGPNELLNNNLDGTFKPIAEQAGIAGDGRGSIQVLPVDIDHDRDLDIIVINKQPPQDIWINNLSWKYKEAADFVNFRNASMRGVICADVSADGQLDYAIVPSDGPLEWKTLNADNWNPIGMWPRVSNELAFADLAGTGNPKIIAGDNWHDGSDMQPFGNWNLAITKLINGYSIIHVKPNGFPVLCELRSNQLQFANLRFTGRKDGNTMRSNASGIGTRYAARIDSNWIAGTVMKNSSAPGQSLQPVAIGLGGNPQIDFVSIDWSDGVFQTEIDLKAGEQHTITETQRQLSSCPVIFAWNGNQYDFVTDCLGVGGIGYMTAPGEYAPERPWENLMISSNSLRPKDGHYIVKLAEPMEEACYLDSAELVAYDLPPGVNMTLDERMNINGPEPTGEPVFDEDEIEPSHAINDRGEDVTEMIRHADLHAAPVGEIDPRFIGRLKNDHVLTLRFDQPINANESQSPPVLVIDGWIEYPYSQTMFAAWQAKADYRAPTIEALGDDGVWHVALEQFGYPAGMPRQMSVPLANLPPKTTQLRITTNQEIYFDRIAVIRPEPMPEQVIRHAIKLQGAKLWRSGFAKRTTGDQQQPHYDYNHRAALWDTRYQRGDYTAFGPMTELIQKADDALAIFGPGEEIHMEFSADLPPIPFTLRAHTDGPSGEGQWTRVFVLILHGWCKDMDLYTKDGDTIGPLPTTSSDPTTIRNRDLLHQRFNTRYESGR